MIDYRLKIKTSIQLNLNDVHQAADVIIIVSVSVKIKFKLNSKLNLLLNFTKN